MELQEGDPRARHSPWLPARTWWRRAGPARGRSARQASPEGEPGQDPRLKDLVPLGRGAGRHPWNRIEHEPLDGLACLIDDCECSLVGSERDARCGIRLYSLNV